MKNYHLINGDFLNKNLLDQDSVDLTITSPPYNVGIKYNSSDDEYLHFTEKWLKNVYYWTKSSGRICIHKCSIRQK